MADRVGVPFRRVLAERADRLTSARWFSAVVLATILGNAVTLGVETYAGLAQRWHGPLTTLENLFMAAFALEVALRAAAHADRPRDFFREPWNVFDLTVLLVAQIPAVQSNATVLRLLRLARIIRAARMLPQLRVLMLAVGKSLPGTLSFLLVGALLLYLYAVLGWICFAEDDPERYGSLGRAVLTLLLLMTLDGLGLAVHDGLAISRWTLLYYGSYVLLASFVLVNLLIGVVINSLEEARATEREERRLPSGASGAADDEQLRARIAEARRALDELEAGLRR
ncbi:ion transporter [Streptomyces sp. 549]|uniref:ion transporter n=1 Tax=Streptomyces sp. 549 TaxID=3049076 RepID=UPI0024C35C73|nr:ion transporter [Streptomyces sp. 549]MDK1473989.1 ion transporter [Streptomyces sp. 549]